MNANYRLKETKRRPQLEKTMQKEPATKHAVCVRRLEYSMPCAGLRWYPKPYCITLVKLGKWLQLTGKRSPHLNTEMTQRHLGAALRLEADLPNKSATLESSVF